MNIMIEHYAKMRGDMKHFWTYSYDGEIFEADFDTDEIAEEAAVGMFAHHIQDSYEDVRNGENYDDDVILIKFYYDANGERRTLQVRPIVVEYTHYHGDVTEHGTP